jgi:hypothetical protein
MRTKLLFGSILSFVLLANAQNPTPGLNYEAGYDDFKDGNDFVAGVNEYSFETNLPASGGSGNAYMGLYWTEQNVGLFNAIKTRLGDGILRYSITQAQGKYEPFLVVFGEYLSGKLTMNLSQNAVVKFKFRNDGTETIRLIVQLQDANGVQLAFDKAVLSDLANPWKYNIGFVQGQTSPVDPQTTVEFEYDFKDAVPSDYDPLTGTGGANPDPNKTFDFSKVTGVTFTIVNHQSTGAPNYEPLAISNYPVQFVDYFKIGDMTTSINDQDVISYTNELVTVYDMMGNVVARGKYDELNLAKGRTYLIKSERFTKKIYKY